MKPASTRVLVVEEANGPFVEGKRPCPEAGQGQVLVRVHASSVNPLDTKIRAGKAGHAQHPFPAILGMDLAGVVEGVGPGVSAFRVGDEVYGLTGGVGGLPGSLADHAAVDADFLALKPKNLSMRESSALPLGAITAWEGLVDRARVRPGQKVLVHGGAGGVGHLAVQIAKALGAEVFATVSGGKAAIVAGFGATPIDYAAFTVEQYVAFHTGGEGFDIVYDTLGGRTLDDSFVAVRKYDGHVVSCLGWGTHSLAPLSFRAATYSGVFTLMPMLTGKGRANHGKIMAEVAKLAEAGKIRPLVNPRHFSFNEAQEAHDAVGTGGIGKIVVNVVP